MGSGDEGQRNRRRAHFWKPFNEWWRRELEAGGKRPLAEDINRWYLENASTVWDSAPPSLKEARVHAKCLRSVDDVRTYFRRYRAKRNSQGGSQEGTDDEDHAPEADHPLPKAAGRPAAPESLPTDRKHPPQLPKRPRKNVKVDIQIKQEPFGAAPSSVPPPHAHPMEAAFASPCLMPSFSCVPYPVCEQRQHLTRPAAANLNRLEPAWAPQRPHHPAGYHREISVQRPPLSAVTNLRSRPSAAAHGQTSVVAASTCNRPPCPRMPTPTVPSNGLPLSFEPLSCSTWVKDSVCVAPCDPAGSADPWSAPQDPAGAAGMWSAPLDPVGDVGSWSAPHEQAGAAFPLPHPLQTAPSRLASMDMAHLLLSQTPGYSWLVPPGLDALGGSGGFSTQPGGLNPFAFSPEQHTRDYGGDGITRQLALSCGGGGDAGYLHPSRLSLSCLSSDMQRPLQAAASLHVASLRASPRPSVPNEARHLPDSRAVSGAQPGFGPQPWPPGTAAQPRSFGQDTGSPLQRTLAINDAIDCTSPPKPKEPSSWPLLWGQSPSAASRSPLSQLFSGNGVQWLDQLLEGDTMDGLAYSQHF